MIPKEYKMLPLEKAKDAYTIPPHTPRPTIGPSSKRTFYRILKMSDDKRSATICSDMTKLSAGELSVMDVDISKFVGTAWVGDIIAYENGDGHFQNPVITHRAGQRHQHPAQLVAPDEK
jgi:hypothetical protein